MKVNFILNAILENSKENMKMNNEKDLKYLKNMDI